MLGRHKNCYIIYLSQSYDKTLKDIRLNCSHYIIFESPIKREKEAICNEHGLDKEAYNSSFKNANDFFCILINQKRLPKGILMRDYNIWDYSIIL